MESKVHYHAENLPLVPIPSQISPVQNFLSYFFKINF
jgi:hypothetical protein